MPSFADWRDAHDALSMIAGVLSLVVIAVVVLVIIWSFKAHGATQALAPGKRKWKVGWTIAGWFIPFANVVIPKLVLSEIELIAGAERTGERVDWRWRQRIPMGVGRLGWVGVVFGTLLATGGSGMTDDLEATASDLDAGYAVQGVGHLVQAFAFACGAMYFRKVGRWLANPRAQPT